MCVLMRDDRLYGCVNEVERNRWDSGGGRGREREREIVREKVRENERVERKKTKASMRTDVKKETVGRQSTRSLSPKSERVKSLSHSVSLCLSLMANSPLVSTPHSEEEKKIASVLPD